MRPRTWAELAWFGATTVLLRRRDPIVGSVILTDRCNLACQHCAVANIRRQDYPMQRIRADLRGLWDRGVRILFLYGGEPFLWHDGGWQLRDVVADARRIGFPIVNVVTNGTRGLALPGIDLFMVSLDGTREHHDAIRGRTYDRVLANVAAADPRTVCLYMAINRVNAADLEHVCDLAGELESVRCVAFNFHTPYPGTQALALTRAEKRSCAARIAALKRAGHPVLDLAAALPAIAENEAPVPCPQCLVVEDGRTWECGRCIDIPGLCAQCGFLFAAELSLLFQGRPRVVAEALRTYTRLL